MKEEKYYSFSTQRQTLRKQKYGLGLWDGLEHTPYLLAAAPRILLRAAEEFGLEPDVLMTAAGLTISDLLTPEQLLPAPRHWSLWREICRLEPVPHIGLKVGTSIRIEDLGLVGYTILHSTTLGNALARATRFNQLMSEATKLDVKRQRGRIFFVMQCPPELEVLRHPVDCRLANIVSVIRQLVGEAWSPAEVYFPYSQPLDISEYNSVFRAPLRFGCQKAAVVLQAASLALPVQTADPSLGNYLNRLAGKEITQHLQNRTLSFQVLEILFHELQNGFPKLHVVASKLMMSPRSLQRRLNEEGISFGVLLDQARARLAQHYLQTLDLTIGEIAFSLGYSEPSSFHRAFRRWTGRSPQEFRGLTN